MDAEMQGYVASVQEPPNYLGIELPKIAAMM